MEQAPTAAQHAREMVVEHLRIQLAGDAEARRITLGDGTSLSFDLLSIATGGEVDCSSLAELGDRLLPVRPMHDLVARWPTIVEAARSTPGFRLIVVGGGAAGVELSLAAQRALAQHHCPPVMLVSDEPELLAGHDAHAGILARNRLDQAGVQLVIDYALGAPEGVRLSDGSTISAGCVIAATGPKPPRWLRGAGLRLDDEGFLAVGADLRSVSHPHVFGAGDIAGGIDNRRSHNLTRSGVHAVRAGPILAENLRRALRDPRAPMRRYRPRRRSLYLISTADGRAILSWGRLVLSGRWAQRLKDRIDRRFVAGYQRLGAAGEGVAWTR